MSTGVAVALEAHVGVGVRLGIHGHDEASARVDERLLQQDAQHLLGFCLGAFLRDGVVAVVDAGHGGGVGLGERSLKVALVRVGHIHLQLDGQVLAGVPALVGEFGDFGSGLHIELVGRVDHIAHALLIIKVERHTVLRHRRGGRAHGDILECALLQHGHRRGVGCGYRLSVGLEEGVDRGLAGEVGREGQAEHARFSALEVGGGSRGGLLTVHVEVDAVGPGLLRRGVVVDEGHVGAGLGIGASQHREVALLEHDVVGHFGEVAAEDVVDARLARLKGHVAATGGQSAHGVGAEGEAVGLCRDEQAVAESGVAGSRSLDGKQVVPLLAVGGIKHVDH